MGNKEKGGAGIAFSIVLFVRRIENRFSIFLSLIYVLLFWQIEFEGKVVAASKYVHC